MYRYANYFHQQDEVTIVSTDHGQKTTDFVSELRNKGIEVIEIHCSHPFNHYSLTGIIILAKSIKRVDLVYVWEPPTFLNPVIVLLARFFRKKSIRGHHNPFFYETTPDGKKLSHPTLIKLYEKLNLFFDTFYNWNHVQNSEHLETLTKLGFKNLIKIPSCIYLNDYHQAIKYDKFSILFLGRLNFHKGADRVAKIVEYALSLGEDISIKIVGTGIFETELKKTLGKCKEVNFFGYVNAKEKNDMIAKSHVLVAPTRVEAFMLTGMESLASGTPVISFKVPGPSEYIINGINGYICNSVEECNQFVKEVYSKWRSGGFIDLVNGAIDSSKRYDCPKVIAELQAVFHKIVETKVSGIIDSENIEKN